MQSRKDRNWFFTRKVHRLFKSTPESLKPNEQRTATNSGFTLLMQAPPSEQRKRLMSSQSSKSCCKKIQKNCNNPLLRHQINTRNCVSQSPCKTTHKRPPFTFRLTLYLILSLSFNYKRAQKKLKPKSLAFKHKHTDLLQTNVLKHLSGIFTVQINCRNNQTNCRKAFTAHEKGFIQMNGTHELYHSAFKLKVKRPS